MDSCDQFSEVLNTPNRNGAPLPPARFVPQASARPSSYPGARHTLRPRGFNSWDAARAGSSQSSSSGGGGPRAPWHRAGPAPRDPAPSMRRGAGAGGRGRGCGRGEGGRKRSARPGGGRQEGRRAGQEIPHRLPDPGPARPARRQRPPRAPDPTLRPRLRPFARPPPPPGHARTPGEVGEARAALREEGAAGVRKSVLVYAFPPASPDSTGTGAAKLGREGAPAKALGHTLASD